MALVSNVTIIFGLFSFLFFGFCLLYSFLFRRVKSSRPKRRLTVVPTQHNLSPILTMSATTLSRKVRAGELTSYQVVSTFVDHCRAVNPYVNAIVFDRYEAALEEAKEADKLLQKLRSQNEEGEKEKQDPGWLLGVPCTVKECMMCKGCPFTSGHTGRVGILATEDSLTVSRVRRAGAIVLGVTNTSELCMWIESHNYVYGITRNPYDLRCLVGGSSGGEGAAIAALFAPFGIGSDVGGSIRMPCFFNGVFGHKNSTRLIPTSGQIPSAEAGGNFLLATGPICRYAEDLLPLVHTMADDGFNGDPALYPHCPLPPKHFLRITKEGLIYSGKEESSEQANQRDESTKQITAPLSPPLSSRRLRVFAIEDLGVPLTYVSVSQKSAVNEVATSLAREKNAEVHIINLRDPSRNSSAYGVPPGWEKMSRAGEFWSCLMGDSEPTFTEVMSDPLDYKLNPLAEFIKSFKGTSKHTLAAIGLMLIEDLMKHLVSKDQEVEVRRTAQQLGNEVNAVLGSDGVIIAPTFPCPAPKHHWPVRVPILFLYTALFNALQTPTTVVPIWDCHANGGPSSSAPAPLDARRLGLQADIQGDFHLPRGVQVAASWGNDILALTVAKELNRMFGGYKPPSWAHFATAKSE